MRWATRRHCHIDRAACAWLIRRFIDPGAEFVFVDDPDEVPADAIPFDMRGVELSHHGGDCSYETFLRRYELADPVLWEIAKIVHEADLADERYDAPEAAGADVLLRGSRWCVTTTSCSRYRARCSTACTSTASARFSPVGNPPSSNRGGAR
jgi:hypothetical protein